MSNVDSSGFRRLVVRKQADGIATPSAGVESYLGPFEINITRSHDLTGTLLIPLTLGSAMLSTDLLTGYHMDSMAGLKHPIREVWDDADPANLWSAALGGTEVLLSVPVRLAPFMAFGILMTTPKAITLNGDIVLRYA